MNHKTIVLLCLYFICSNITFSQIEPSTTVCFGKDNINGTKITFPFKPIDGIYFVNIASGLKSNAYKIIKY